MKIILNTKKSPVENIKTSIFVDALAKAKAYELLHKQIWRKTRDRVWTYDNPFYRYHKGRPVSFIRGWNIKSESKEPYAYELDRADHPNYGLNQLFVGQDYRKPFEGDPADDGIYHDDCYIQPKAYKLVSGLIEEWAFVRNELWGDNYVGFEEYHFDKQDKFGTVQINNVAVEFFNKTVNNVAVQWVRLVVDHVTKGTLYYELGKSDGLPIGLFTAMLSFRKTEKQYVIDRSAYEAELIAEHGAIVFRHYLDTETNPVLLGGNSALQGGRGEMLIFHSGLAIEFVPYTIDNYGDGGYAEYDAHYKILPMVYTDTGDLTMGVKEFVDNWEENFELIVHEDKDFWTMIIAAVVIAIATYFTAGAASGAAASAFGATAGTVVGAMVVIGGVLTIAGMLSGNAQMMRIGGIFSAVGGIAGLVGSAVEQGATQLMMNDLAIYSGRTAQSIVAESSFGQIFEMFASGAGLTNWVGIGSSIFSLYNDIQMLGMENIYDMQEAITEDMKSEVSIVTSLDEDDDVMSLMRI